MPNPAHFTKRTIGDIRLATEEYLLAVDEISNSTNPADADRLARQKQLAALYLMDALGPLHHEPITAAQERGGETSTVTATRPLVLITGGDVLIVDDVSSFIAFDKAHVADLDQLYEQAATDEELEPWANGGGEEPPGSGCKQTSANGEPPRRFYSLPCWLVTADCRLACRNELEARIRAALRGKGSYDLVTQHGRLIDGFIVDEAAAEKANRALARLFADAPERPKAKAKAGKNPGALPNRI